MQPTLGVHPYLEAALLNEAYQNGHQVLGLVGLIHQCGRLADVGRGIIGGQGHIRTLGIGQGFGDVLYLFQPAVALGDLLDGLPARGIADEQPQFLHIGQLLCHRLQSGEEEIAHGEPGRLAARQNPLDVINEALVAVVYDVVDHCALPDLCLRSVDR